ncbi:MAG: LacI family DNA-binding transcriptional regulator [Limimaricola soesokkakensis]|uniref:LacI family DNA-binding transcriptional regulator n=1 Tax=Limimaricola soesokkakensis TaxID=1343159 RepID=UPI00405959BF
MTDRKQLNRPTLSDVARLARVSPATVSRYLADPEQVMAKRRDIIQSAIDVLDYVPHAAARSLASNSSRIIGAIFPRLDSILFSNIFELFQKEVQKQGYTLILSTTDFDMDTEHAQLQRLLATNVDALALVGARHQPRTMDLLAQSSKPYVLFNGWDPEVAAPQVGVDNWQSGYDIARHLIDLGHRRIGMISADLAVNDRADARAGGVRAAMSESGLDLQDTAIYRCHFSFAEGGSGLRYLLDASPRPTAIICGSDMLAVGAVLEAQRLGVSVPDEISVTGFDDIELGRCLVPALTSMRTPRRELVVATVEALTGALLRGEAVQSQCFSAQLMARDSTAPCPG